MNHWEQVWEKVWLWLSNKGGSQLIRGISFQITQDRNSKALFSILKCINVEKYKWYYIENQSEVWSYPSEEDFFKSDFYDGKDFNHLIEFNHYIVFLKLQAYCETEKIRYIHTYKEFEESNCQLLLLIHDCEFVEIFIKSANEINALYQNAKKLHFSNIQYITDCNDHRTKMDIL